MARRKPLWTAASTQAAALDLAQQITKEFGIKVDGPFDMGIDSISFLDEAQVRELGGIKVDSALVSQYTQHIKAGVALPPIIVNDNQEMVDGNTRKLAAAEAGQDIVPVVVVHTEGKHTADRLIGGWANQRGGKRLTDRDSARLARDLAAEGMKAEVIAGRLGYSPNKVARIVKAVEVENRATALGLKLDGVQEDVKVKLHTSKLPLDVAFVEALSLVQDANLKTAQVTSLVKALGGEGTEEGARATATAFRKEHAERIEQVRLGLLTPKPSPWQQVAMHIGALVKLDVTKLEAVQPKDRDATLSRLDEAIGVLQAARSVLAQ